MSTLLVASILVALVAAVCFMLVHLDNKQKRKAMNHLLDQFSQAGSLLQFTFSSQEILKDAILGLDGARRKLVVVKRSSENVYNTLVIDLFAVNRCSVKKQYGTINSGELKTRKPEQYLEEIVLHFEVAGKEPVEIVFYKHFDNHLTEIAELEAKAKQWETILSKMIAPLKKTA